MYGKDRLDKKKKGGPDRDRQREVQIQTEEAPQTRKQRDSQKEEK